MPLRVSDNLTFPRMRCALYSNAFKEKYILVAASAQHIGPSAAWVQTPSHLVKQLDLSLCGVCNSGLPASAGLLTTLWCRTTQSPSASMRGRRSSHQMARGLAHCEPQHPCMLSASSPLLNCARCISRLFRTSGLEAKQVSEVQRHTCVLMLRTAVARCWCSKGFRVLCAQ